MKVVIAIDSLKGSLTSLQAGEAIKEGIKKVDKETEVVIKPLADGGEGTVDAYTYNYGHKIVVDCEGKSVEIGVNEKDNTCIIEMASVNGVMDDSNMNILERNTYKTGILIKEVLALGYKNIMIGIGGSGTNDCGIGIAAALGYRFLDVQGKEVLPYINNVFKIKTIDATNVDSRIKDANFIVLSDVKNPLLGKNSCAHMYGKQKGADEDEIELLEKLDARFFGLYAFKN